MGNAFMAVDAGFTLFLGLHVLFVRGLLLKFGAHGIKVMAIATFARITVFHPGPLMGGQLHAFGFKFFGRIDAACDLSPNLKTGL